MSGDEKVFTLAEVKEHSSNESCWVVIHDEVYDVTKFLEEHPGGEEVLMEQSGNHATEAFEDVGHSSDARELMKQYKIGRIANEDKENRNRFTSTVTPEDGENSSSSWSGILIPLAIIFIALIIYKLFM